MCPDCPAARATRDLVFDAAFRDHLVYSVIPFVASLFGVSRIVRYIEARIRVQR